jgi:hypothetical protein
MILALVNEAGQHVSLWQDYLNTQFDPAHLLSELGFTVFFDLLVVFVIWGKFLKPRLFKQIHDELDAEHGVTHEPESDAFNLTNTFNRTVLVDVGTGYKTLAPGDTLTYNGSSKVYAIYHDRPNDLGPNGRSGSASGIPYFPRKKS